MAVECTAERGELAAATRGEFATFPCALVDVNEVSHGLDECAYACVAAPAEADSASISPGKKALLDRHASEFPEGAASPSFTLRSPFGYPTGSRITPSTLSAQACEPTGTARGRPIRRGVPRKGTGRAMGVTLCSTGSAGKEEGWMLANVHRLPGSRQNHRKRKQLPYSQAA